MTHRTDPTVLTCSGPGCQKKVNMPPGWQKEAFCSLECVKAWTKRLNAKDAPGTTQTPSSVPGQGEDPKNAT